MEPPLVAEVLGDISDFLAKIAEVKSVLAALSGEDATVTIDASVREVTTAAEEATAAIDDIPSRKDIAIEANVEAFKRDVAAGLVTAEGYWRRIQQLREMASAVEPPPTVEVIKQQLQGTTAVEAGLAHVREQMRELSATRAWVHVNADGIAKTTFELRALRDVVAGGAGAGGGGDGGAGAGAGGFFDNFLTHRLTGTGLEGNFFQRLGLGAGWSQILQVSMPLLIGFGAALVEAAAGFTALAAAAGPAASEISQGVTSVYQMQDALSQAIPGTAAWGLAAAHLGAAWAAVPPEFDKVVQSVLNLTGLFGAQQAPIVTQAGTWLSNLVQRFATVLGRGGFVEQFAPLILATENAVNRLLSGVAAFFSSGRFAGFIDTLSKMVGPAIAGLGHVFSSFVEILAHLGQVFAGGQGLNTLVDLFKFLATFTGSGVFQGFLHGWLDFERLLLRIAQVVLGIGTDISRLFPHINTAVGFASSALFTYAAIHGLLTRLGLTQPFSARAGTGSMNVAADTMNVAADKMLTAADRMGGGGLVGGGGGAAKTAEQDAILAAEGGGLAGLLAKLRSSPIMRFLTSDASLVGGAAYAAYKEVSLQDLINRMAGVRAGGLLSSIINDFKYPGNLLHFGVPGQPAPQGRTSGGSWLDRVNEFTTSATGYVIGHIERLFGGGPHPRGTSFQIGKTGGVDVMPRQMWQDIQKGSAAASGSLNHLTESEMRARAGLEQLGFGAVNLRGEIGGSLVQATTFAAGSFTKMSVTAPQSYAQMIAAFRSHNSTLLSWANDTQTLLNKGMSMQAVNEAAKIAPQDLANMVNWSKPHIAAFNSMVAQNMLLAALAGKHGVQSLVSAVVNGLHTGVPSIVAAAKRIMEAMPQRFPPPLLGAYINAWTDAMAQIADKVGATMAWVHAMLGGANASASAAARRDAAAIRSVIRSRQYGGDLAPGSLALVHQGELIQIGRYGGSVATAAQSMHGAAQHISIAPTIVMLDGRTVGRIVWPHVREELLRTTARQTRTPIGLGPSRRTSTT